MIQLSNNDILNIRNDVLFGIQNRKSGISIKAIMTGLRMNLLPFEALGDILGEAMNLDNEFVMTYLYPKLIGKLPKFLNLYELDQYIFNKFCLLPEEQMLAICEGQVLSRNVRTYGRVYITNARYMISGRQQVIQQSSSRSLVGAIVATSVNVRTKHVKEAIARTLRQTLSDFQVLEWGYYFLISGAYKIQNKGKRLIYWTDIPTEKKTLNVKFVFAPTRIKRQPKPEFLQQRDDILRRLEDLLQNYSI